MTLGPNKEMPSCLKYEVRHLFCKVNKSKTFIRVPSTIGRGVARNTSAVLDYVSHHTQLRAATCRRDVRRSGKQHTQRFCWGVVRTMLGWKGVPRQISPTAKWSSVVNASSRCLTTLSIPPSVPRASLSPSCVVDIAPPTCNRGIDDVACSFLNEVEWTSSVCLPASCSETSFRSLPYKHTPDGSTLGSTAPTSPLTGKTIGTCKHTL